MGESTEIIPAIEHVTEYDLKFKELALKTEGNIYPRRKDGTNIPMFMRIAFFTYDVFKGEMTVDEDTTNTVEPLLTDYIKCRYPTLDNNYFETVKDYALKVYKDCMVRHRMHRIYKTKITLSNGKEFSMYDFSTLKLKDCEDDTLYKNPPEYIEDFHRFTEIIAPLDLSTVYFYNSEAGVVLDISKMECFRLS